MTNPREDLVACRRILFGAQASPECGAMLRLLEIEIGRVQSELETCAVADVEKRQGELRGYRRMVKFITEKDLAPTER